MASTLKQMASKVDTKAIDSSYNSNRRSIHTSLNALQKSTYPGFSSPDKLILFYSIMTFCLCNPRSQTGG